MSGGRVAVAVIGTNIVFDYGSEEAARSAFAPLDAARASVPLDVELLADALRVVFITNVETGQPPSRETLLGFAQDTAAEYARLAAARLPTLREPE